MVDVIERPVALTRAAGANEAVGAALTLAGLWWVEWPAVAFRPLAVASSALDGLTGLAFVSPTAVAMARDLSLPDVPVIAQGPGTASALAAAGLRCDAVADPPDAEGLAAAILAVAPGGPVGLLRGDQGLDTAPARLRAAGTAVRVLTVYENVAPDGLERPERPLRAAVFASPSAATRLLRANPWLIRVPAVAIGATTADALRDLGHRDVHVADEPTPDALCRTILEIP